MKWLRYKEVTVAQSRDSGMAAVLLMLLGFTGTGRKPFLIAAIVLQLVNMTLPAAFRLFAVIWLNLSRVLGEVSSRVLLSVIYFGVVTPLGLIRRVGKKDAMQLKTLKQGTGSVMVERNHKFCAADVVKPY